MSLHKHCSGCTQPIVTLGNCRGVGARALSNGINSAVFFCFFEALRATFAKKKEQVNSTDSPHI